MMALRVLMSEKVRALFTLLFKSWLKKKKKVGLAVILWLIGVLTYTCIILNKFSLSVLDFICCLD